MSHTQGVDSEAGRLGTVLLHHPGTEPRRITPRNSANLLLDAIPWPAGRSRSAARRGVVWCGVVYELLEPHDFVIDPLLVPGRQGARQRARTRPSWRERTVVSPTYATGGLPTS